MMAEPVADALEGDTVCNHSGWRPWAQPSASTWMRGSAAIATVGLRCRTTSFCLLWSSFERTRHWRLPRSIDDPKRMCHVIVRLASDGFYMPAEMKLSATDAVPLPSSAPSTARTPGHSSKLPRPSRLDSTLLAISPLLLLLLLPETCSAQPDPVKSFCRRFGHQTAVIDRKLYIDGGFINYNPLSQYPTNYSSQHLPATRKSSRP